MTAGSLLAVFVLPSQSAASFLTYILALCVVAFSRSWWPDIERRATLGIICATLLVYLPLSSVWSQPFDPREAFSMATRALLIGAFLVAVAICWPRVSWMQRWLLGGLVAVSTGAALVALAWFWLVPPEDGRLTGLGQLGAHVLAALCFGVGVIACLAVRRTAAGPWRGVALACMAVLIAAIALSGSRNAWVSVPVGALCFVLSQPGASRRTSSRKRALLGGAAVAVAVLGGWMVGQVDAVREFLLPRGDSYRLAIWQAQLQATLADGAWLGRGILTADEVEADGHVMNHPHSMYLATFVQGGVVGLALFLSMLGATIQRLWSHRDERACFALGVLGIGMTGLSIDGWELIDKVGPTWLLIWMPVALALVGDRANGLENR